MNDARVARDRLGFVYMDIEGYETMACLGLTCLMAISVPLYIVFSPRDAHPQQSASFLRLLASYYHRCLVFEDQSAQLTPLSCVPVNRSGMRLLLIA